MTSIEMTRDKLLTVRMSAEELGQLEELGKLRGTSGSNLVRGLVAEELTRAKLADERERRTRARYWMMDKLRLKALAKASGLRGLDLTFHDEEGLATLTQHGKVVAGPDVPGEIELYLRNAVGTLIAGGQEDGAIFVAESPTLAQEAREAIALRRDLRGGPPSGGSRVFVTKADIKKYDLQEVEFPYVS